MQATITSKGQITLPKALREQLHLVSGDRVEFIIDKSNIVRMLPRKASVTNLKGMLPKPDKPVTLEEMEAAIAAAHSKP
ncbi:MAG TPA: AbrB/MazE/SpoVT family DNA-binding domain-containing protein [Gammaproteobacteria bacterium]|nr:AbrB/MazE/SpoVT family DNA-binding domain-containing protein [Gammaproteobacteria bacterium]